MSRVIEMSGLDRDVAAEALKSRTVSRPSGCCEWIGPKGGEGYGIHFYAGRRFRAHRVAWYLANGTIPDGYFICHRCDNPACVNLEHLFLGTPKDNMDDMAAKGRRISVTRAGEACSQSVLTDDVVASIRTQRAAGESCATLAAEVGVTRSQVWRIVAGRAWRHLTKERVVSR